MESEDSDERVPLTQEPLVVHFILLSQSLQFSQFIHSSLHSKASTPEQENTKTESLQSEAAPTRGTGRSAMVRGVGTGAASADERKRRQKNNKDRRSTLHNMKARALKQMGVMKASEAGDEGGRAAGRPPRRRGALPGGAKGAKPQGAKRGKSKGAEDVEASREAERRLKAKQKDLKRTQKKKAKTKMLFKRTKKGQPVMKHRIEDILSKI